MRSLKWIILFLVSGLCIGGIIHFMSPQRTCYETGGCWDETEQICRNPHTDKDALKLCRRLAP